MVDCRGGSPWWVAVVGRRGGLPWWASVVGYRGGLPWWSAVVRRAVEEGIIMARAVVKRRVVKIVVGNPPLHVEADGTHEFEAVALGDDAFTKLIVEFHSAIL